MTSCYQIVKTDWRNWRGGLLAFYQQACKAMVTISTPIGSVWCWNTPRSCLFIAGGIGGNTLFLAVITPAEPNTAMSTGSWKTPPRNPGKPKRELRDELVQQSQAEAKVISSFINGTRPELQRA